jgi:hypothetical protein
MNEANREQIEFWNRLGERWVTYQESLDRVWRPLGDTTIERAAVMPGERVIDRCGLRLWSHCSGTCSPSRSVWVCGGY